VTGPVPTGGRIAILDRVGALLTLADRAGYKFVFRNGG
jgi:hypothetical protein